MANIGGRLKSASTDDRLARAAAGLPPFLVPESGTGTMEPSRMSKVAEYGLGWKFAFRVPERRTPPRSYLGGVLLAEGPIFFCAPRN
jgi:hypothetical protein